MELLKSLLIFIATVCPLMAQPCTHPLGVSDYQPGVINGCNDFVLPNPAPYLTLAQPLFASQNCEWIWRTGSSPIPATLSSPIAAFIFYGAVPPTMAVSVPFSTFGSGCLLVQPLGAVDVFVYGDWALQCADRWFSSPTPYVIPAGLLPPGISIYAQAVYQDFIDPAQRVAASQPIEIVVQP